MTTRRRQGPRSAGVHDPFHDHPDSGAGGARVYHNAGFHLKGKKRKFYKTGRYGIFPLLRSRSRKAPKLSAGMQFLASALDQTKLVPILNHNL
jgi:hypothetical protein